MKTLCLVILFSILTVAVACRPASVPELEPLLEEPIFESIGYATMISDLVEHAPGDEPLARLSGTIDLFPQHRLAVRESGEALLDFGDALRVNLFNNSELNLEFQVSGNSPLLVHYLLWRGGLIGEKFPNDNDQVIVETPAGDRILIIGTIFFVTYDANTQVTTVGNFGGKVYIPTEEASWEVPDNAFIIIRDGSGDTGRVLSGPHRLEVGAEEFAGRIRALNSPLAAVDELLAEPEVATPTASVTASVTPTETPSPIPTLTPTLPPTFTPTFTPIPPPTETPTLPPTLTPTFTPLPPTETFTPIPTETPTPTSTPCPPLDVRLTVDADRTANWEAFGGCPPIGGNLYVGYKHLGCCFFETELPSRNGSVQVDPPVICEGTFTIVYQLHMYDAEGQEATDAVEVEVHYIC
jgi:hypothetical protein